MKPFNLNNDDELMAMSQEQLQDSIRLEAIERGIKPPITLPDALLKSEWRGYQKPAESVTVYGLKVGYHDSRFGWLSEAKAIAAMEGIVEIDTAYRNGRTVEVLKATGEVNVVSHIIGVSPAESASSKFEAFMNEKEDEFNKLVEECLARYSNVRQERYNSKVRAVQKYEYLRLAQGDEEIAKAFWAKAHMGAWPTEAPLDPNKA
jgi:hypothetical protein